MLNYKNGIIYLNIPHSLAKLSLQEDRSNHPQRQAAIWITLMNHTIKSVQTFNAKCIVKKAIWTMQYSSEIFGWTFDSTVHEARVKHITGL